MCGLLILINSRGEEIGLEEIRNPQEFLSRFSLEWCFSLGSERAGGQELPPALIYLFEDLFIELKESQKERKRQRCRSSNYRLVRAKAMNPETHLDLPHRYRDFNTQLPSVAFPGSFARSWISSGAGKTWTSTRRRCWPSRCLNLVHRSAIPTQKVLIWNHA